MSITNSTNIYYVAVPALMRIPNMDQKTAMALSNTGSEVGFLADQTTYQTVLLEEMQARLFQTGLAQGG